MFAEVGFLNSLNLKPNKNSGMPACTCCLYFPTNMNMAVKPVQISLLRDMHKKPPFAKLSLMDLLKRALQRKK